jgi:quinoprotein glucose dehydrogenase
MGSTPIRCSNKSNQTSSCHDLDSEAVSSEWLLRPSFLFLARARNHFVLVTLVVGFLAGTRLIAAQDSALAAALQQVGEGWPTYGGDTGGLRFSNSSQITRGTVGQLHPIWTFHTHATDTKEQREQLPSFEATPVLSGDTLYFTSPFDVVFALDARTGIERWHYDPILKPLAHGGIVTSRGVALSNGRVFVGTLDARLIALDAKTGKPCADFGNNGSVDLSRGVHFQGIGFYGMTSPPTVVGNVVVVGSTVGDNQQVDIESGLVRGYDAISGKLLWTWEPLPWAENQKIRTGAGNVWAVISADPALGLVYLPTGSAAPDIYGGLRPGDNRDANSIVALDAKTGKKVWAFQVVHHDVWDYDIPSEPILFTWRGTIPAIAVTTKMGMVFLFDRRTGQPLVPVEERPVAQSDVPGEQTSPTQPFQNIPSLAPLLMGGISSYQRSSMDEEVCHKQLAGLRYEGIYTPPSLTGTLNYPGPTGGVNWGGAAIDPNTGILYANTNRIASVTRLVSRRTAKLEKFEGEFIERVAGPYFFRKRFWAVIFILALIVSLALRRKWPAILVAIVGSGFVIGYHVYASKPRPAAAPKVDHFGSELSPQRKSPYLIERHPLTDTKGFSCTPAPWGAIGAINLNTLTKVWEKPLGTMIPNQQTGIRNFGGPIVTASGLVITAGAEDFWLRIFNSATGEELQKVPLPVPAVATPMTYTLGGRQYIVVAAGGHGDGTVPLGDALMAFAVN